MEQNSLKLEPLEDATQSEIVEAAPIELQPAQGFEVKLDDQAVHIEQVFQEGPKDPKLEPEEGEVQVIYLNVPETEEPQVLDLSSLLAQQGIQVVDQTEIHAIDAKDGTNVFRAEDIIIEGAGDNGNVTVVAASQSEAQSAHALLNLANAQAEETSVQVSDILAAQRQAQEEEENATAGKALLELASDQNAATYIVDENGTMIPLSDVRGESILPVEDTGVTTIAICQCYCGREFISQEDLERHKAAHKIQRQNVPASGEEIVSSSQSCALCPAQFSSMRELVQHHKETHPGEMPWECDVCSKRYHKKVAMKAHMRVHNAMARYQCSTCKKVFYYKRAMTRHIKQHTCEKPFKCTICGEMLNTLWELRKHRINHQVRSLYHCDICSKVFKQKATLVVHSRVHTGQRPYACDICSKSFSLKSTLTQHRRIYTGEKPNVCPICGQRFRQGSTMLAHMKRHTHDKPFICRYCRMRFAYQDELTEHELAHAHNKKWQCDECGMRFKNQSLLARHCRRHTNERPFVCEVCNKSFVQSGSLRAHMRSHTNEKPYYCRMCSKAYATSGTLLLHIRKVHNLAAKTVKEVFPVHKYIEDQKIFTIRNKPLGGNEMAVHSDGATASGERVNVVLDETNATDTSGAQQKGDNTIDLENVSLGKSLAEAIEGAVEQLPNVTVVASEGGFSAHHIDNVVVSTGDVRGETVVSQQVPTKRVQEPQVLARLELLEDIWNTQEDGSEPVQVAAEVDISSHSLHSAQDRQEAALGLAELSLFGAGAAGSSESPAGAASTQQPSNQKTKTFFKEEEEDENDPNVTKIILSKEGGVMNSQDPHQCPICHRIFGRKSIMVEHLRIHTDEKPYECDFCHAGFRQNAQLRSHIRNRHTKVERYQCSFCHNRFLSRSITIRHIKFHHKLKMKFCQEANPEWTVDAAVWCDDKFEFNIEDPQYLKVSKKNKATGKKLKRASANTDHSVGNLSQSLTDMLPSGQTYVVKVSDQGQMVPSEVTIETSAMESHEITLDSEELKTGQSIASARTVGTLTYATPGNTAREDEETLSNPLVTDSEYMGSQLLCGTCKMQFSSVASLREHLRSVHNTTLAESDVSYVFEDNVNDVENQVSTGQEADDAENRDQVEQSMSDSQGEITLQDLKPVVLSIGELQQRKGRDEMMDNSDVECTVFCRMCSQGFYYRDDLDQHMKSHTEEEVESVGMHRCDTCSLVMKNTQEVAKHIQRCHGVSKIFSCSICDKEFYQESSVYRHMKFFHKWEIKIRGESNIPVIVKPAPTILHNPATSSSGYTMPKTRTDRRKVGRYSKFPTRGTAIGAEVDKIIQDVVESKVESTQPDKLKIEFGDHGENLLDKAVSDSLTASSSVDDSGDSQAPSFIIVRDGAEEGQEDTQKIVEKLMALFRSKADSAGGDSKKLPKIIKVTTVGFSQDEINTITETDLTEAFNQLGEDNKIGGSNGQTDAAVSVETASQVPGSSDENVSGKGYISTLQGKKRVVGQEPTVTSVSPIKQETKVEASETADDATESSLAKILKNCIPLKSAAKINTSSPIASTVDQEELGQASVKAVGNLEVSKPVSSLPLASHRGHSRTGKSKTGGDPPGNAQDKPAPEKRKPKTVNLKRDLEDAETGQEGLGTVPKKPTISTLATPPQNKDLSVKISKPVKTLKNIPSIDSANKRPKTSDKAPSVVSEQKESAVKEADVIEGTSKAATESKASDEKTGKSPPKKVAKVKVVKEKSVEPERRSSSGRLIKAKKFGDEIEDMSPLRKRQK